MPREHSEDDPIAVDIPEQIEPAADPASEAPPSRTHSRSHVQVHAPRPGDIVLCRFPDCFDVPEMIKTRAVIVVATHLSGCHGLALVVPLSRKAPVPPRRHHCPIPRRLLPTFMQSGDEPRWAKCDMVYAFSLRRLSPITIGRRRRHEYPQLDTETLRAVRLAVSAGMGIDPTTFHAAKK